MVGQTKSQSGLFPFVILFSLVSLTSCFVSKEDVEGFKYLGSYRSYGKDAKYLTEFDYFVSTGTASWLSAKFDCEDRGGGLLWFNTTEELQFVADWLSNHPGLRAHWTSGVYADSRGTWLWETTREEVPEWVPWDDGVPPLNPNSQSAMTLLVDGIFDYKVRADQNDRVEGYICKIAKSDPEPPVPIIPCYKTLDLELVLDSSGSIGDENFAIALSYLSNLTTAFTVHNESRLGFLTFSTAASRYIPLTNVLTPDQIVQTIHATPYYSGTTNTDLGVDMALASLIANKRPGIPQAMVILTDGASNDPAATAAAALRVKNAGISMYSVGITSSTNEVELLRLAGDVYENVFHAYDWADLIPLLTTTSEHICPKSPK